MYHSCVCGFAQRIWSLGPKRTGPNFLLSSETSGPASLFSVPEATVVKASAKQDQKKSAFHPAQAEVGPGGVAGGPPQVDDPALRPSEQAETDTQSEMSAKVCFKNTYHLHTVAQAYSVPACSTSELIMHNTC